MPSFRLPLSGRRALLADGWDRLERAGRDGPLDDRARRLVELAVAVATADPRTLRTEVQRARDHGVRDDEIDQLIALAAPAIGKARTLAAHDAAAADTPAALDAGPPRPSDA
jgi:alkylhydroperoxidase/carboxymuconolactone decarboxylase family protein YurZ